MELDEKSQKERAKIEALSERDEKTIEELIEVIAGAIKDEQFMLLDRVLDNCEDLLFQVIRRKAARLHPELFNSELVYLEDVLPPTKFNVIRGKIVEGVTRLWIDDVEVTPEASLKVRNHSPDGFTWGYYGSGPAQTALAILLHVTGDKDIAQKYYQTFKEAFIAKQDMYSPLVLQVDVLKWVRALQVSQENC